MYQESQLTHWITYFIYNMLVHILYVTEINFNDRKWKLFNYMSGPKIFFEPHIEPKNSSIGPKKSQNNPKIKSELKKTKKMKIIALYE